jgi:hypothetical protein
MVYRIIYDPCSLRSILVSNLAIAVPVLPRQLFSESLHLLRPPPTFPSNFNSYISQVQKIYKTRVHHFLQMENKHKPTQLTKLRESSYHLHGGSNPGKNPHFSLTSPFSSLSHSPSLSPWHRPKPSCHISHTPSLLEICQLTRQGPFPCHLTGSCLSHIVSVFPTNWIPPLPRGWFPTRDKVHSIWLHSTNPCSNSGSTEWPESMSTWFTISKSAVTWFRPNKYARYYKTPACSPGWNLEPNCSES